MFLVAAMFLVGCDSAKVYEEYIEVENNNWLKENVASFEFDVTDTVSKHNLYLNVRNTGDYAFNNLYLFISLQGPNGNMLKDTVNCELADKSGKWLGKGIGDLWDIQIPYVGGFKFAQSGKYTVSMEQGMRVNKGLEGITDVGLRVEKAK